MPINIFSYKFTDYSHFWKLCQVYLFVFWILMCLITFGILINLIKIEKCSFVQHLVYTVMIGDKYRPCIRMWVPYGAERPHIRDGTDKDSVGTGVSAPFLARPDIVSNKVDTVSHCQNCNILFEKHVRWVGMWQQESVDGKGRDSFRRFNIIGVALLPIHK